MEELGVLHQLIEGAGGAGAAGRAADGGGLVGQIPAARVGETVHEAGHVAGGGSVMHRRAEDKGVGSLGFLDGLVDHAAEDVQDLRLDAGGVQLPGDEAQCGIGAALLVGAAVDEQDFHDKYSPFVRPKKRRSGMILAHS